MSAGAEGPRRVLRVPSVPSPAGGLLAALSAALEGDESALRAWEEHRRPLLESALRRKGLSSAEATEIAHDLLVAAFFALRRGHSLGNELAWIAGTAARLLARRRRAFPPVTPVPDLPAEGPGPLAALLRKEARETARRRIRDAAAELPPPYREIVRWQLLDGRPRRRIGAYLRKWALEAGRPVGAEQSRWLIRESHRMFRREVLHGDARLRWPGRYGGKNPWTLTPPPALPNNRGGNSNRGR